MSSFNEAIKNNNLEFIRKFLASDTDRFYSSRPGRPLSDQAEIGLFWAIQQKKVDVLKLLLTDPNINVNFRNGFGSTPLHEAIAHHARSGVANIDSIKLLLNDIRVDVNAKNNAGDTPLSIAAIHNQLDIVKLLLTHPAIDINSTDVSDYTPLELVIRHKQIISAIQEARRQIAAELLAVCVFFSNGLLKLKKPETESEEQASRFFKISKQLPLELQMVLCNRAFGVIEDNVPTKNLEPAFQNLAKKYRA